MDDLDKSELLIVRFLHLDNEHVYRQSCTRRRAGPQRPRHERRSREGRGHEQSCPDSACGIVVPTCQMLISFERNKERLVQSPLNPLATGQSKIGRRRPISLDNHCVTISQRIFINKISLERSFHYLNADTLFLKIGQEMTPLQPFEVTQLIDFALDRSTSVTCGRDFAHSITMVT